MNAPSEVAYKSKPWADDEDMVVVALWYPEPHNVYRVEVQSNDLPGDLANMTVQEAVALARALIAAAAVSGEAKAGK